MTCQCDDCRSDRAWRISQVIALSIGIPLLVVLVFAFMSKHVP